MTIESFNGFDISGLEFIVYRKFIAKEKSQFITDKNVARLMAERLVRSSEHKSFGKKISFMDPGAGTGVLSIAFIESLIRHTNVLNIKIYLVENDERTAEILRKNMLLVKNKISGLGVNINFELIQKDFLTTFMNITSVDFVISNPPFKKLARNFKVKLDKNIVRWVGGNLYSGFVIAAMYNLKKGGVGDFLIPRSWTSGAYFVHFRQFINENFSIKNIDIFKNRQHKFLNGTVQQELVNITLIKNKDVDESVVVTQFEKMKALDKISFKTELQQSQLFYSDQYYLLIPTQKEMVKVLNQLSVGDIKTFESTGFSAKVGKLVDFRLRNNLSNIKKNNSVTVVYSSDLKEGSLYLDNKNSYKRYFQPTKSIKGDQSSQFVLLRRFSPKESSRRIDPVVFSNSEREYYVFDNKIIYLSKIDGNEITSTDVKLILQNLSDYRVQLFFNMLSGTTQINAKELNYIPIFNKNDFINLSSNN